MPQELSTDVLVVGAGLGGVAAALAAADAGCQVVLTEEMPWLGGQLTAQGVPMDDHPWADLGVGSRRYRRLRAAIRHHYRDNYPLTTTARARNPFNPGQGNIGALCAEPRVAAWAINQLLSAHLGSGRIICLHGYRPVGAETNGDIVSAVTFDQLQQDTRLTVTFRLAIDATELGDLLNLADIEHVIGAEAASDTGELHALPNADPLDQQAFSWSFAVDYRPGEEHVIERPDDYEDWRHLQLPDWPGPQFSWTVSDHVTHQPRERPLFAGDTDEEWLWDLWHARRILYRKHFREGFVASDITLANWPQMDYWSKPLLGVSDADRAIALEEARGMTLSFLYWMQTEAPRHDGGTGYPELRLRPDVLGTRDGLAMHPYIRESRRIVPEFRVLEQHIGAEARAGTPHAAEFADSVGIGAYRIDLHPTTTGRNTVDIDSLPFQIPLGAIIPVRVDNVIAGGKNVGTTRITNGAYRVHSVEWGIGEAAGVTAAAAVHAGVPARAFRRGTRLADLQRMLTEDGVDLRWPEFGALVPTSRPGWQEAR